MDGVRKKHISFLTTIVHHFKYNALLSISATLWSQFHFPPFIALSYFYGGNIPLLNTDFLILRVLPFGAIKYDTSKLWRATPFHCSACMCACFPCSRPLPSPSLNGYSVVSRSMVHKCTILQLVRCISHAQIQSKPVAYRLLSSVSNKIN